MATYADPERVRQTIGPTISSAIDFADGTADSPRFVIEDDGFPNVLLNALQGVSRQRRRLRPRPIADRSRSSEHVRGDERSRNVMVWLGAGGDAADGELTLKRPWFAPWTRKLELRWNSKNSTRVIDAILAMHRDLSEANRRPHLARGGVHAVEDDADAASARRLRDGRPTPTPAW